MTQSEDEKAAIDWSYKTVDERYRIAGCSPNYDGQWAHRRNDLSCGFMAGSKHGREAERAQLLELTRRWFLKHPGKRLLVDFEREVFGEGGE